MDEKFHKKHIKKAPFGYAYHKIIMDDNDTPVDYKFIEVNPAYENLTGLKSGDIKDRKASEVAANMLDDCHYWANYYADTAINGKEQEFEQYSKKLQRWFNVNVYSTEKYYFITIFTDITNQKHIEKTFQQERILLKTVINNLPDCIYAKDLERRKILTNEADLENMGFSKEEEALGKTDYDTYPYDIAKEFDKIDLEVINKGKKLINVEDRLILPSGNERYLNSSKLPLYDENKKIIGLVGIGHDITERKKTEKALRESEDKFRTLFTQMTEMVVLHDLIYDDSGNVIDYRILDCNPAFEKTTGINRKYAIGRRGSEVYQSSPPPNMDTYSKVALSGEPHEYTTYYEQMDKYFNISIVSPKKGQFATITNDITAIKKFNEMMIEKNKELENYLYVASHDLRSPLVNIQGFSARLKKQTEQINKILDETGFTENTKSKIKEIIAQKIPSSLEYIFNNVSKMDSLINSLLQISRTGRVAMTITKTDMTKLIDNVMASLDYQIKETRAKIITDNLPECYGDEKLLNQLFTNIVSNALKYRKKNIQPEIKITSENKFKKVIYSVEDNGIGINKKYLDQIWDVFFRVGNEESKEPGEGIGLSIAKRIVDKHKGKIWVESVENKGSTFFILLPKEKFEE